MKLKKLIEAIDTELSIDSFHDASFNGLQVEGAEEVATIVLAVSACQEVFDMAIELGAQLVLVHHGLFWEGADPRLVSFHGKRIKTLLQHNISLAAYHLPLDAHMTLGNNAQIAHILGLKQVKPWGEYKKASTLIGVSGELDAEISLDALVTEVDKKLNTVSSVLQFGADKVKSIAVVSGGAGNDFLEQALNLPADVLITGELEEPMYHLAKEAGINVIGAAHYATERWGVMALGEWLEKKFANVSKSDGLTCEFVEVENPL